jgi:hypothetical protein
LGVRSLATPEASIEPGAHRTRQRTPERRGEAFCKFFRMNRRKLGDGARMFDSVGKSLLRSKLPRGVV